RGRWRKDGRRVEASGRCPSRRRASWGLILFGPVVLRALRRLCAVALVGLRVLWRLFLALSTSAPGGLRRLCAVAVLAAREILVQGGDDGDAQLQRRLHRLGVDRPGLVVGCPPVRGDAALVQRAHRDRWPARL